MAKDLYNRYVWLIETIRRRGRITRSELDERWRQSPHGNGNPLCRRTLYNYRTAIREIFNIDIRCDEANYEYYIEAEDAHKLSVTNWLLNSRAVNDALAQASDVANRIFLEDVPSAREHLGTAIAAIQQGRRVRFDYYNYARSRPTRGVVFEPYFLKIFKQRWYLVGRHVAENKIKTYALDRVKEFTHLNESFEMPATFVPDEYFRDAFGIIVTQGEPKRIALRVDARTAHYLRDLPLHHSQQEVVHDGFVIFYYKMLISNDLITELLSYGPRVTVLEPLELRNALIAEYRNALANYSKL